VLILSVTIHLQRRASISLPSHPFPGFWGSFKNPGTICWNKPVERSGEKLGKWDEDHFRGQVRQFFSALPLCEISVLVIPGSFPLPFAPRSVPLPASAVASSTCCKPPTAYRFEKICIFVHTPGKIPVPGYMQSHNIFFPAFSALPFRRNRLRRKRKAKTPIFRQPERLIFPLKLNCWH